MRFYKINFKSIPKIIFAHRYSSNNYNLNIDKIPNECRLEMTYVETGDIIFKTESGNKRVFAAKTLNTNIYNEDMAGTSNNKQHIHITVGISGLFDTEIIEKLNLSDININENTVIIPETLPVEYCGKCKNIITDIIRDYTAGNVLKAVSYLFDLFSLLNDFSVSYDKEKSGVSDYDNLYIKKAKDYISENIYTKIALRDIASYLEISEGHLCRIFKKSTGVSLINFINKTKIDIATEMLLTKRITTLQLASQLGVEDEKYFSRLFKQHTGKTVTEYKKLLLTNE